MADMINIVDFNSSDGLPPWVIQKLNYNFWGVVQKIVDNEVVIVAGVTEPTPRTDETLWYNTETGDLYIWREFNGHWGWDKIDIGYIHVDPDTPPVAAAREENPYVRKNEFLWIAYGATLSHNTNLFIWTIAPGSSSPNWYSLGFLIYALSQESILYLDKNDWLSSLGFVEAVKEIHNHPNDY